ncbi:MAG TPA: hypothetical protein DCO68_05580 [Methylophilaceae bacterium]|nr:hypothetical protein [Methylophilaceae bacterium]HAJ71531.1 hypothetical protein [Methylophilaceae bacterium]
MSLSIQEKIKLRESFLEITSDSAIRMAAYTLDEWLNNGGSLLGYGQVSSQDAPPIVESYPGGLFGDAFRSQKPLHIKQDGLKRATNLAEHWQKVESHDYYKWLKLNSNFLKAWGKFQKQKIKQSRTSLVSILVINEFADFRFLRLMALNVGFQMLADEAGYKPTYPDAKTIDKTKGYITKLRASFKGGVKIDNLSHQAQLDRLLEQLLLELNLAPRKEKITLTTEKRKCLEAFAYDFMSSFQFISPTILNDLAAMLDWTAEHTTIDRIVKNTKTKKAQLLAKALKSYTAQKS